MRKKNVLSVCLGLIVMVSCSHNHKASVTEVKSDSLSETIKNAAPSHNHKASVTEVKSDSLSGTIKNAVPSSKIRAFVNRKNSGDLVVFTPTYNTVDLVCGKRPNKDTDTSVAYCAAAAFTGECLNSFVHRNVAGNHVSSGVFYRGYALSRTNTGAFVWYQGKWKFLYDSYADELKNAEKHRGMGFGQNMIIFNGRVMPRFRKDKPLNIYRALCELDGKLCIVEARQALAYSEFVEKLANLKVKYALYLDMGPGWNYSWYRDSVGTVHVIHPIKPWSKYQTNWIVFKK